MSRRELAAWLLVAYLFGSTTTPSAGAQVSTAYFRALYAIRNAIARNCEATAYEPSNGYDSSRCWR